jgi:hypothetical protein
MVVFIDESYRQDSGGTWHYALAGIGVNEFRYRALQAAVYQLIRKYFAVSSDYEGDSWRADLADKMIINKPLAEVEIKAAALLSSSGLRRYGDRAPGYRLASEILAKVGACRGICLGVLTNPATPDDIKDCSHGCPRTYQTLIEKVGQWMQEDHLNQSVMLVLDTEHNNVNLPLSRAIADYLYRTSVGQKLRCVFPSPFWVDSQSMAGAQVADLVAHILMDSMMPESERKPIRSLWQQVNDLRYHWEEGRGGTITRTRR